MKVKVTPRDGMGNPIPGAGSWEEEVIVREKDGGYELQSGALVPASWCKGIPEITPEPGDIVEGEHGLPFFYDPEKTYSKVVRVLARKPMEGLDAHDAIHEFFRDLSDAETASANVAAYNKFLSAILGVPYGRVGG